MLALSWLKLLAGALGDGSVDRLCRQSPGSLMVWKQRGISRQEVHKRASNTPVANAIVVRDSRRSAASSVASAHFVLRCSVDPSA